MNRSLPILLSLCLAFEPLTISAAVRGKEAKYIGGTIASFSENADVKFDLGESAVVFTSKAKGGAKLSVPYNKVDSVEYGQKAGRRLGLALAISPLFLLSHKRKHFVTINFEDDGGKKQGAVFELAKGIVHDTLSHLEAKTGKKVDYESDEARKHAEKR